MPTAEQSPRARMAAAMRHRPTDRVPVMCQLAIGHYFLHAGLDPLEIWHDSAAFGEALVALRARYGFDGILVNLPGRDPDWRRHVRRIERREREQRVYWRDGRVTVLPADDLPHTCEADQRTRRFARLEQLEPERLHYIEPHDIGGIDFPWRWSFAARPADPADFFPPWQLDTIRWVRDHAPDVSVHGEVFSPFSQLMELLDFEPALMALYDDPGRVGACLDALAGGTAELMSRQAAAGVDAILISSAFAGGGFLSPEHYRRFVLPCEQSAIARFRVDHPDLPVYTHTCGAIGDRLELLAETGTGGIDTLDPPPLGNTDLADAKRRVGRRLFLKGNIDPVNTLLLGSPAQVRADALARLATGSPGGGYILSTACSVPPRTPPEHILELLAAAEDFGTPATADDTTPSTP
jgi:uroporphyrinogen decarboxylase